MSKQTELAQVADTITVNSGNVGIGEAPSVWRSADRALVVGNGASQYGNYVSEGLGVTYGSGWYRDTSGNFKYTLTGYPAGRFDFNYTSANVFSWHQAAAGTAGNNISFSEAMRLDASGRLLHGKTTSGDYVTGTEIQPAGAILSYRAGGVAAIHGRTDDGEIIRLTSNSSIVGIIGCNSGNHLVIGKDDTGLNFQANEVIAPSNPSTGATRDNAIDLGASGARFDDIYATNGTIQTSDRNEKQDIAELSDAEQRVAVAAKGLLRKFRWRDAVTARGDEARTHFGIIAQDLQAAFAAEGLDAGDYAMFISTTWWETQTEVPAVEAVAEVTETTTDEDGNEVVTVVTEAVEAKDAYTRTDTYETQEEAPEGATERTRLGVRYSELLAFIIGAL